MLIEILALMVQRHTQFLHIVRQMRRLWFRVWLGDDFARHGGNGLGADDRRSLKKDGSTAKYKVRSD